MLFVRPEAGEAAGEHLAELHNAIRLGLLVHLVLRLELAHRDGLPACEVAYDFLGDIRRGFTYLRARLTRILQLRRRPVLLNQFQLLLHHFDVASFLVGLGAVLVD